MQRRKPLSLITPCLTPLATPGHSESSGLGDSDRPILRPSIWDRDVYACRPGERAPAKRRLI